MITIVQTLEKVTIRDFYPVPIFCVECTAKYWARIDFVLRKSDDEQGHDFYVCPICLKKLLVEYNGTDMKRKKYGPIKDC